MFGYSYTYKIHTFLHRCKDRIYNAYYFTSAEHYFINIILVVVIIFYLKIMVYLVIKIVL